MPKRKRNYRREYDTYQGKPEQIRNRSERNKARRQLGLKVGDPREVDHIIPMKKGGGNARSNLRITTQRANRKKGAK